MREEREGEKEKKSKKTFLLLLLGSVCESCLKKSVFKNSDFKLSVLESRL